MRKFVRTFVRKVPELDHEERSIVRDALEGVSDFNKVCDLIESHLEEDPRCPYCNTGRIHKHGIRSGLQRYKCAKCGKTFNALAGTPLARLRKKELWLKYMNEMLESRVLRDIAAHFYIDKKTAFLWRHRFSTWLYKDVPQTLNGIVEADETYFRISKKGCRTLGRKAHKRGGDDAVKGLSKNMVCVLTAEDRSQHSLEYITGLGPVKGKWLDLFLTGHIAPDAVLVTDGQPSYKHFCRETKVSHVTVSSKNGARVNGTYHIQHINAFHGRIQFWINRHFRGVATKYLNHYLWWRHELENKHIYDAQPLFQAVLC